MDNILDVRKNFQCEKCNVVITFSNDISDVCTNGTCLSQGGPDIVIQDGYEYGWSESNVQYERLGKVKKRKNK